MFKYIYIIILLIISFYNIFPDTTADIRMKDRSSDLDENEYIDSNLEGETLTVVAANQTTQQIDTITKDDIIKENPIDVIELLEKTQNISIRRNGSYGNISNISIRGLDGGRVAVLIDGVPVNSAQSGVFDLSAIDVNNIEKIEIIKGGSDSKFNYNGAIGGVINIITKKKNKAGFHIYGGLSNMFYYPGFYYSGYGETGKNNSMWYDFFDTQNVNLGIGLGNEKIYWNLSGSGNRASNNFIYEDSDSVKRRRINNGIYDGTASTNLNINLPLYMMIICSGDFHYANKNIPGHINTVDIGKEIDYFGKGSLIYKADFVGNENIDTELSVNYCFNSTDWTDNTVHNIHNLSTINAINRWGFILSDFAVLHIGGDFQYDYLDSNNLGKINSFNGGGYISADFSIKKIAKIVPSIKLVYYKDYPIAVPKLGFVFYIGENFILKNNYFRAYKLPTINDKYWPTDSYASGNPDLRNEDGVGGDLILSYHKDKILSAEGSVYLTYLRDAITWQPQSNGKWMPLNIGNSFYFGSDQCVKTEFSKYFKITLNYSFLLTYAITDDFSFEDDKRMPYKALHTFSFGVEFNWGKGFIEISGKYESERYTTIANVTRLNPYFDLDLNFNQQINKITLYCLIKNILNNYYYLVDGYPMPGGSVTIGIKFNIKKEFDKKKVKSG